MKNRDESRPTCNYDTQTPDVWGTTVFKNDVGKKNNIVVLCCVFGQLPSHSGPIKYWDTEVTFASHCFRCTLSNQVTFAKKMMLDIFLVVFETVKNPIISSRLGTRQNFEKGKLQAILHQICSLILLILLSLQDFFLITVITQTFSNFLAIIFRTFSPSHF